MRGKFVLLLEFYLVVPLKKFAEEKSKGNEIRSNWKNKKTKKIKKEKTPRGRAVRNLTLFKALICF